MNHRITVTVKTETTAPDGTIIEHQKVTMVEAAHSPLELIWKHRAIIDGIMGAMNSMADQAVVDLQSCGQLSPPWTKPV